MKVQSTIYLEIAVTVEGTFVPGCIALGPSYSSGGSPAEPDTMEDVEITSISTTHGPNRPTVNLTRALNLVSGELGLFCERLMNASMDPIQEALLAETLE